MSVLPSILLSACNFSRNWLIIFFWNLACCQGCICSYMWQSRIFWKKNPHRAKMTRIDKKWLQNRVFGLFKKIMLLVLSGNCVKWKFLRFINILWKLHAWENLASQVIPKNGSQPVRFPYSLIVNISLIDFDFWHADRHEWEEQGSLTDFLKKFSFGQMGHYMPKNCTSS